VSTGPDLAEELLHDVDQAVGDVVKELDVLVIVTGTNESVQLASGDIRETLDDLVINLRRRVWLAQIQAGRVVA
jgi:hypothetical protein